MHRLRYFKLCLKSIIVPGCLALLGACAALEEESTDFRVVHESVLRSDMRQMARSLDRIVQTNLNSSLGDRVRLESILAELDHIQTIASGIGGEQTITNYSVINQYMGAFLYDVGIARDFALKQPANFVPATHLIQSCLGCHQSI